MRARTSPDEILEAVHLLPHQLDALRHVDVLAAQHRSEARVVLHEILDRAGLDAAVIDDAVDRLRAHARVVVHFHPDRLCVNGQTVVEGLLETGIYRNQYETGVSNGSPTAFPEGERDLWEQRLFGGAYHRDGVASADRPKYGALDIMRHPDGASPRFGSCYLVLNRDVTQRSSFTFLGSQKDEALECTGVLGELDPVLAAVLMEVEKGKGALGKPDLTISGFLEQLTHGLAHPFSASSNRPLGKALDSFIEAQVHGAIRLRHDVERLVADPAFRGSPTGDLLQEVCFTYDIALDWHPGFVLPVSMMPDYFRGLPVKPLAQRIAGEGLLDAATIGRAANSHRLKPELWSDFGTYDDGLTLMRRIWHVVVYYGFPAADQ